MTWVARVVDNIFPLSEEKRDLKKALSEWEYRGDNYGPRTEKVDCELCNHPQLIYQFGITNRHNGNYLRVGSECIKKFGSIKVLDGYGDALPADEARRKVDRDKRQMIQDLKTNSVLCYLVKLGQADEGFDFASFEQDYTRWKRFTPWQLHKIIEGLEENNIPYNKEYFKTAIRYKRDKEALLTMNFKQLERIWDCLSSDQKGWVKERRDVALN